MSIAEAWASDRPIYSRLPGVNERYNPGDGIADHLTYYWDALLIGTKAKIDDIPARQLNPLTCDVEWLDFLAPLCGWDALHWRKAWTEQTKRTLLANSYSGRSIWETKGTLETLSFVLTAIGIRNQVTVDGDFIVGSSEIGEALGAQPWAYRIYLPPEYERSDEYRETLRIDRLFGPAWCTRQIIFDEERFAITYIMGTGSGEAIATLDGEGIEVFE